MIMPDISGSQTFDKLMALDPSVRVILSTDTASKAMQPKLWREAAAGSYKSHSLSRHYRSKSKRFCNRTEIVTKNLLQDKALRISEIDRDIEGLRPGYGTGMSSKK